MKPSRGKNLPILSRFVLAGTACAALAACATDTSLYPSLARRDAERVTGNAEVAGQQGESLVVPVAPPAGLGDRLGTIVANAEKSHRTFLERATAARKRSASAAGAAPGTLAWSDAEVALSNLESARSDTMFALADLDLLLASGTVSQAETGESQGLQQIETARSHVAEIVAAEDMVLAELRGRSE